MQIPIQKEVSKINSKDLSFRIKATTKEELLERAAHIMIVLVFFNSLGFPGKMTELLGNSLDMGFQYFCFLLEILLMFFYGVTNAKQIAIIDLDKRFFGIYFYTGVVFVLSMIVTCDRGEQVITCIRLSMTALFAIWISRKFEISKITEDLCKAQWLILISVLLFMALRPDSAFVHEVGDHDFVGIMKTKNNMAAELSLGILLFFLQSRYHKLQGKETEKWVALGIVVQGILLLLCNAKGSLIGALLALCLLGYDRKIGRFRLPAGWFYVSASALFPTIALTILPVFEPLLNAIGKDATLTGRIPLWRQIVNIMTHYHTFTGYGFGMAWRNKTVVFLIHSAFGRYSFMGNMSTGSHNVILELWLNIGLIGVFAYFLMYLTCLGRMRRLSKERYLFCSVYTILFLLFGLTERSMSPYDYHTLLMFLSLAQGCVWEGKRAVARNTELSFANSKKSDIFLSDNKNV